jgi:hypothetical protein
MGTYVCAFEWFSSAVVSASTLVVFAQPLKYTERFADSSSSGSGYMRAIFTPSATSFSESLSALTSSASSRARSSAARGSSILTMRGESASVASGMAFSFSRYAVRRNSSYGSARSLK